jgi:hypothetical protein
MQNFLKDHKVDWVNAAVSAANNTDDNSSRLDMSGFEGVVFIVPIVDSVATGVATLTVEENSADSDTGMTAISGAVATATCAVNDDINDELLIVDVYRPQERYVQGVITSATANIAFGATIAIRYNNRKGPITQDTDTVAAATFAVGS